MPQDTGEEEVWDLFSKWPGLVDVRLSTNRATRSSKGFAFLVCPLHPRSCRSCCRPASLQPASTQRVAPCSTWVLLGQPWSWQHGEEQSQECLGVGAALGMSSAGLDGTSVLAGCN